MTHKLAPMKKGASSGVYRSVKVNPNSTLVNYYTQGSGVGAVSTSNRRALRRRASWRPTDGGKSSRQCTGQCLGRNIVLM